MSFQDHRYELKVRGQNGTAPFSDDADIESGCLVFVYTAGTKTLATLYSDENRTALSNPISRAQFATDEGIKFYAAASSMDLVIADDGGNVGSYPGVSKNDHLVVLDKTGVSKHFIIPFSPSDNTEVDTGIDLPLDFECQEMLIEVVTLDAGETLDVGLLSSETNGDANGLLAAISVNGAGYIRPIAVTTGLNESFISGVTYGALTDIIPVVGTDLNLDTGQAYYAGHIVSGANARSVTYTGSAGSDTAAGYIHIFGRLLR